MLNLDIYVIIELYWGTDPSWDGNELAIFFNCGYQSIYNYMSKYGVLRREHLETQIKLLEGSGAEKQLIIRCPKCKNIMNFSEWISPYKYLFTCPICKNPTHLNVENRVTKPEDRERVKKYKKTADGLAMMYAEAEGNK